MFYTYILKSQINNSYYIGSCKNMASRLLLHNGGKVLSTKRYTPWEIIYYESFQTLRSSRQREKQIKLWKSREAIEKLIQKHFIKIENPR